jgi:hypothetical protein
MTLVEILARTGRSIEAPHHLWPSRATLLRAMGRWHFVWDFAHFRGA